MMVKIFTILLFICFFLLFSCRKDESSVPNLTAQQVKLNNLDYMTLKVTNSDLGKSFYLHKSGQNNQTATCQISKTDLSVGGQEILCWLEAEELDLYFNGVDLKLEVPSGVCDYVTYTPYYFYQYQWGRTEYGAAGQPWIYYNASGCDQCKIVNFTLQAPFLTTLNTYGECFKSVYTTTDFDYTESGLPNCDEGTVTARTLEFVSPTEDTNCDNSTSGLTSNEESVVSLGGLRGNCINGVGAADDFTKNRYNLPMTQIYRANDGIEQDFNYASPLSLGYLTNLYLANYIKDCATSEYTYDVKTVLDYTHTNIFDTTTTDVYAQNDPLKGSSPFYTWTCYNKAEEVKGIIRLQIREWNVNFSPSTDGIDKTNPTKMDLTGNEDLSYPQSINDIEDWDDKNNGASCSLDSTSFGFSYPGVDI